MCHVTIILSVVFFLGRMLVNLFLQYFPSSWKDEGHGFLSVEFKSFFMEHTEGEVNLADGQVPRPIVLMTS